MGLHGASTPSAADDGPADDACHAGSDVRVFQCATILFILVICLSRWLTQTFLIKKSLLRIFLGINITSWRIVVHMDCIPRGRKGASFPDTQPTNHRLPTARRVTQCGLPDPYWAFYDGAPYRRRSLLTPAAPDQVDFFLEDKQGCGFGKRLVFTKYFSLEILDLRIAPIFSVDRLWGYL